MKYDRPVWQLMYDCAAAMPDPFRYEDVHRWFGRSYPEVGQATIRAHLVGMCEGGRPKQMQFASRAPLFRRVARGMYEVIPEGERKVDPDLAPDGEPTDGGPTDDLPSGDVPSDDVPTDEDPFAASAFDDATVVPAATGPSAPDPGRPRVRADDPSSPGDGARFDDLIAQSGLARELRVVPDPTAESADVLLVAGDGERVLVPAPAREIDRSEDFQLTRLRAQARGASWYVLSAEHGLLDPAEWVSPDSRALGHLGPHFRAVWAAWVLVRLESLEGPVAGRRVHVIAPHVYVGPLAAVLQDAGAEVSVGGPPGAVGRPTTQQERAGVPSVPRLGSAPLQAGSAERASTTDEDEDAGRSPRPAPVARFDAEVAPDRLDDQEVADVVRHLADTRHAVVPDQLDGLQDVPGLFAWHVDIDGARTLNRSLMLPVGAGVLHVGHAGALGRRPDAVHSVRHLVQDLQLDGRSRCSTFRSGLAVILSDPLGMTSLDDPVLAAWMRRHLRVVTWPTADRESIHALAHRVVASLEPPLNVDHLRAADMRRRLAELRREVG